VPEVNDLFLDQCDAKRVAGSIGDRADRWVAHPP
jgi:hypothetical protein